MKISIIENIRKRDVNKYLRTGTLNASIPYEIAIMTAGTTTIVYLANNIGTTSTDLKYGIR